MSNFFNSIVGRVFESGALVLPPSCRVKSAQSI